MVTANLREGKGEQIVTSRTGGQSLVATRVIIQMTGAMGTRIVTTKSHGLQSGGSGIYNLATRLLGICDL
jgi:hypothetical protein